MMLMTTSDLPLERIARGKVRDVYAVDADRLLLVATDRVSAYDVVMAEPIPKKGAVLTQVSAWWFKQLGDVVKHHMISADADEIAAAVPVLKPHRAAIAGRAMLCRRGTVFPIECVIRGYITGSAWREYAKGGTLAGESLPAGLRESDKLPEPVFTPSTKAESGHDVNISFDEAAELVGADVATRARDLSLALYTRGAEWAAARGIIIADTKFELGFIDGELAVADEVLTPDSSRFWPADAWAPGATPPSFDKQPVRDYLETLVIDGAPWAKTPPPPPLPEAVLQATRDRYREAYERITDRSFADWPGAV